MISGAMTFDVYKPWVKKDGKVVPGVKAFPMDIEAIIELMKEQYTTERVDKFRAGDKAAKTQLYAVDWMGTSTTGKRLAADMKPTQFIMVDIDHVKDVNQANAEITSAMMRDNEQLAFAAITPSGEGLRYVIRATQDISTVADYLAYLGKRYEFAKYGNFDSSLSDLSRISFLGKNNEVLYLNHDILSGLVAYEIDPIVDSGDNAKAKDGEQLTFTEQLVPPFTDEEIEDFESREYRGYRYKDIIEKYLQVFGQPGQGEKHNYYNEMVKNFRCICDNDKRFLLYVLPAFDHTLEERWSQIVSICRVNTLSRLPKTFYFFLKDNGFYSDERTDSAVAKYMMNEKEPEKVVMPPYLPPVFRELVGTAPADFIVPCVNALMPILGTLTSYLRSTYPYDNREHSTSFFSVIYAPAGTGKGFVERFIDLLFEDLKLRDFVESERENVYLRALNKKSQNDKSPDMPHVSVRLIPPKNSEPELLQKMRDNDGYHMFTFAAEMDSWSKGVRAAGGNKDDMVRIAWDNGEYGQQFKSASTFKGNVRLYWNVLITGTIAQVESYFKNVENGLVTRCAFTAIENQEFRLPPVWKKLSKRDMKVIMSFTERCDRMTYTEPCTVNVFDLPSISDEDFDTNVDWHFTFRPKTHIDMSWLMPTIDAFHKREVQRAAKDVDRARDVFRRRVAVRGFRLGMICYALWEKPRESDLKKCIPFIEWWMEQDLKSMLKLWGEKYNSLTDVVEHFVQRSVFDNLDERFTRNDVYALCMKQGIRTPVRRIIHEWSKIKAIEKLDNEHFKKLSQKQNKK